LELEMDAIIEEAHVGTLGEHFDVDTTTRKISQA
jgi:hypothetical protein